MVNVLMGNHNHFTLNQVEEPDAYAALLSFDRKGGCNLRRVGLDVLDRPIHLTPHARRKTAINAVRMYVHASVATAYMIARPDSDLTDWQK